MAEYHFSYPIEVRYGDLDPQGHLNNANFLTYLEQARIHYFINLGLMDPLRSFLDIGFILADAHITFISPVQFGMDVRVDVQVTRLGNKSLNMAYRMRDGISGLELATATTVLVAYDYHKQMSILLPEGWKEKINLFEGLPHKPIPANNIEMKP